MRLRICVALICSLFLLTACGGGGGGSKSSSSGSTSGTVDTGGITGSGGTLLITTSSLPSGIDGRVYSAVITTSGGNGRLTFSISPGSFFPSGLSLDPGTGTISGTERGTIFGDVTFKVTDSGSPQQTALKTLRMTFSGALMLTTLPNPVAAAHTNVPYKQVFYAGGWNGDLAWTVNGSLPPGLSLNKVGTYEADLTGTPTQVGKYDFSVQAVDHSSPPQTATLATSISVDNKLAIASTTLPVPYSGELYTQTVTAVNGTPPYHWSGQLPSFFQIDANTGILTATPSPGGTGNYSVTVTVTDSSSPQQTASQNYGMLILPRLAVNSSTLVDAHLNDSYNANLSRQGGQGDLAWSIISGSLPPGLSLQSRYGIISGIPSQEGDFTFGVQLQDSSTPPQMAQGQFTIAVKAPLLALQPSLPARIPVNVPFEGIAAVSGGAAPIHWNLYYGSLPAGLTLESSTGRVSGTPTSSGPYTFALQAKDSSTPQQTSNYTYNMTVGPALGRNDTVSKATPIANSGYQASISPLVDPPEGTALSPDTDYYRIMAAGGATVTVNVNSYTQSGGSGLMDPVLELVDANGQRLHACRLPGDQSNTFASACLNDDADDTTLNSKLEYRVPGNSTQISLIYAHVLDWRGDARPDLVYFINATGTFVPIVFQTDGALPDVAANSSYYLGIYAKGGTGNITGTITNGQLPPGIMMVGNSCFTNPDGTCSWYVTLTGGPTTPGTYTFTLELSDQAVPQQKVSRDFTIHVFPQIQLVTIPDQVLKVGTTSTYQATVSGGIPPFTWSLSSWPGATIDRNTGLITFQPTVAGQFTIDVWVLGTGLASGGTQWSHQLVGVTVTP